MRDLGFTNDAHNGPICRWKMPYLGGTLKVDAIPINGEVLGFHNQWYEDAVKHSISYTLDDTLTIKILTLSYFLATKLEAFNNRGNRDFGASQDMEDIIYVMENKTAIELVLFEQSNDKLKHYFKEQAIALLANENFRNYLPGLLDNPDAESEVLSVIKFMSNF